jgi:acyl-CoA synthetase (AMP-forming)/AMP-acid ligase II
MIEAPTLWHLIEARAEATPHERMAVDPSGRELDFAGYRDAVLRAAGGLHALGVGPDSMVAWMLPTRIETLVLVGALARLGATQIPILPVFRGREVGFIVGQCRPSLLVTPGIWRRFDYPEMAREIAAQHEGLETLVVEQALPEAEGIVLPPPPAPLPPAELPIRWILYTSGTTSEPKGVQHTDASLWEAARVMSLGLELAADDRIAFVFPVTHVGGINWLQAGLSTGCSHIMIENFAEADTIPTLAREGVTQAAAGTVFHEAYLAAHRKQKPEPLFARIRSFPGGGAPKPPQLHYDLRAEMGGAGIISGYGLTECPILAMNRIGDPDEKLAETEGRPSSENVDLRVVRSDGSLADPGEEGELRVRAPQLFRGYVNSSLDEAAFDADGYFRTGDLGVVDAQGYVVITGRLKDVIIRKGENIPAKEVEDVLYLHPKVADVAVIGLPDPNTGERCCAVVACHEEAEPLGFEEMQQFLREKDLMIQKIPEQLELVDEIPRNATGKILKHELRDRYAG